VIPNEKERGKGRAGSGRRRTAQLALEVVPVGEGGEGLDELSELDLLVLVGVEYGYDPTQQWIASQLRDRQEFICWSAIVEKEESQQNRSSNLSERWRPSVAARDKRNLPAEMLPEPSLSSFWKRR